MSKKKKITVAALVVLALVMLAIFVKFLFGIVGGILFWMQPSTEIKNGFSDELVQMISEDYGISIPDSAEFICGEYDSRSSQDRSLNIVFRVPERDLEEMFDNRWEAKENYDTRYITLNDHRLLVIGGKRHLTKAYTYADFSEADNYGMITCDIYLYRPLKTIE